MLDASLAPYVHHDTGACEHLLALFAREGITQASTISGPSTSKTLVRFERVIRWSSSKAEHSSSLRALAGQNVTNKKRKKSSPACTGCGHTLLRPFACLSCDFVGCPPVTLTVAFGKSQHKTGLACLKNHMSGTGHEFGVDPETGAVYCLPCTDFMYSDTIEAIASRVRRQVGEKRDHTRDGNKQRGQYQAWEPSETEQEHLMRATKIQCHGLRPLLNLSQTCFLSAVLQALIANPLLRAYFLSDKHNRRVCQNGNGRLLALGRIGEEGERDKGCMCCEMDAAFDEFYSDDKQPFGPITMLYSMWNASGELEGHGQQDAHSFFLAALDQMHAHAKGQLASCNCIAHQTFAGSLLSTVTCTQCQATSSTIDPILDIQLDLSSAAGDELTLATCLRRFCAKERVGDKGYACGKCHGTEGKPATKQLVVKKLPPVLSFQLKRFAHGANATSTKVETTVRFPSRLDMKPYTESGTAPASVYQYDLFAVVTHEGKLDNGHYWADVLAGDEWWHCDDDRITPTTLSAVLAQKAYMLFYVKHSLEYVGRAVVGA